MELKKKEERSFRTGKTQRQEDDQNLWHITWRRPGLSGQAEKKTEGKRGDPSGGSMGGRDRNGGRLLAGSIGAIGEAAQKMRQDQEEENENPYIDPAVCQMLAYVSYIRKDSQAEHQKKESTDSVSESDTTISRVGAVQPMTDESSIQKEARNAERIYSGENQTTLRHTAADSDVSTPNRVSVSASLEDSQEAMEAMAFGYRSDWWSRHKNANNTGESISKRKTEHGFKEQRYQVSVHMAGTGTQEERDTKNMRVSDIDTEKFPKRNHGNAAQNDDSTRTADSIVPSKAVQAYQQESYRKNTRQNGQSNGNRYQETGKNSGEKNAAGRKRMGQETGNILQGRGVHTTSGNEGSFRKTAEKGASGAPGRPTAVSFVEAAWKAGKKIREEGFGKKNQDRQLNGSEREIFSHAQYETKETSKKLGNLFITVLFGIPVLPILLLVVMICLLLSGSAQSQGSGLSAQYDKACYLAAKYESGGNPDQTGGDGGNACGEFQFDNRYELGPFVSWCYEKDPTFYAAFQPFLGMTTELKSNEEFFNAWHTVCAADKEVFEAAQCEYVYNNTLVPLLQEMTEHYGFDFVNCSAALKGCILSFGNRDGKYVASIRRYFDGTTAASSERDIIEHAYDVMIARRPYIQRWRYEKIDCLALYDGTLDVYEPSSNAAGSIDWSWKRIAGGSEVGNLVAQIAVSKVGCGYSQSMRDQEGWYDCSSLVYRCYAEAGITYLNGKTAADEAQYLVEHGMTVSASELQPGDIIFYSYESNGRYRNISHVAIYIGNNEMVHAANSSRGVVRDPFRPSNLSEPLYGRPQ